MATMKDISFYGAIPYSPSVPVVASPAKGKRPQSLWMSGSSTHLGSSESPTIHVTPPIRKLPKPPKVWSRIEAIIFIQAFWRMFVLRKRFKKELFRSKVVRELFSSEEIYVSNIELLINIFLNPMRKLVTPEEHAVVFSNVETIFPLNSELIGHLKPRIESWNRDQMIGDILLHDLSRFIEPYSTYTNGLDLALQTIEKLKGKSQIKTFMKTVEQYPECQNPNPLPNLLIQPVQRIARYPLLLKELLRYTPTEHVDHDSVRDALAMSVSMAARINENKRDADSEKQKELDTHRVYKSIEPRIKILKTEKHTLVKEGTVNQYDTEDEKLRERYFFLFSDLLVLTTKKPGKGKYILKETVFLNSNNKFRIENMQDGKIFLQQTCQSSFILHTDTISYFFSCATEDEKKHFLDELKRIQLTHS